MSLALGLVVVAVGLVAIEVVNVALGLWSDRLADRLRRAKRARDGGTR